MKPTIGRTVIYHSRTGNYIVPAIITATKDTLDPTGVQLGHVPDLSSDTHVHLTVFTPGQPGLRRDAEDFLVKSEHPLSENVSGCYQEWDIPNGTTARTWDWPSIVPRRRIVKKERYN